LVETSSSRFEARLILAVPLELELMLL